VHETTFSAESTDMNHQTVKVFVLILLFPGLVFSRSEAQESTLVVRIGKWVVSELGSYAIGKALDRSTDTQNFLKLSHRRKALLEEKESDHDPELTRSELRAVDADRLILYKLLTGKVDVSEVEALKTEIETKSREFSAVLANHEERLRLQELRAQVTGLWKRPGYRRWLKIEPDGSAFACYADRSGVHTSSGKVELEGKIDWQHEDWGRQIVSREGVNLVLSWGQSNYTFVRESLSMMTAPGPCDLPL
jgi:hypothetical protein